MHSYSQTQTESPTGNSTTRRSNGRGRKPRMRPPSKESPVFNDHHRKTVQPASNRQLYMAPQATIRGTHTTNYYQYGSGSNTTTSNTSGGMMIDMMSIDDAVAMNAAGTGTRRRRHSVGRGEIKTASGHRRLRDSPPTRVERQESDGSLGAMAKVLVADRTNESMSMGGLPPAPILWDDDAISDTHLSLNSSSPARGSGINKRSNKRLETPPPERKTYRQKNYPLRSPGTAGKTKKMSEHTMQVLYGTEDFPESALGDSFHPSDHSVGNSGMVAAGNGNNKKKLWSPWNPLRWYLRIINMMFDAVGCASSNFTLPHCVRICILLMLALFVYDSHSKVQSHKTQLREYDEERSHILEQMMWIDKAAKKVHKKYSEKEALDNILDTGSADGGMGSLQYQELAAQAKQDLMAIQHNIQLNARAYLASAFGENPAQVLLQIADDNKLIIGLSDDTPHAISTLVQQVNRHLWDSILLSKNNQGAKNVIDLVPKRSRSDETAGAAQPKIFSPLLEFVERSHGCRNMGSVALRQETPILLSQQVGEGGGMDMFEDGGGGGPETSDESYLVLSVYLEDNTEQPIPKGSVCIGQVLEGMDALVELQQLQTTSL